VDQVAGPVLFAARLQHDADPLQRLDHPQRRSRREAYVVALDKTTGVEKWRIDRGQRIRSYWHR